MIQHAQLIAIGTGIIEVRERMPDGIQFSYYLTGGSYLGGRFDASVPSNAATINTPLELSRSR
jgi:hypothetical protein